LKRRYDLYLKDILGSIERIKEYTGSDDAFMDSNLILDAVLRNLEIIGEAATQVPPDIKEKYASVPWRDIQDFRIVAAHHYWKINKDRVFEIVQDKLDDLHDMITLILQKEYP